MSDKLLDELALGLDDDAKADFLSPKEALKSDVEPHKVDGWCEFEADLELKVLHAIKPDL